ncbi:MAG: fluoride efflux transporter CrcB [Bacteroidota bacterium]|nr:fluoride efflux transporter CrcB [Bacteroidota bacterium]
MSVLVKNILLVGMGGMAGSMLRYLVAHFIKHDSLPYATFAVNIVGSLLIGLVMGLAAREPDFANWRLLLATGFCGGFTTFSAFTWENLQLIYHARYGAFLLYTVGSLVLGLAAVTLGYRITK